MLLTRAGAEIAGLVLNAFVAIWLSRTVGADGLGYWAVTQVLIRFGGAFTGAGYPTVGSQRVAHREERPAQAWSIVTSVRLTLAVIAVVFAEIAVIVSPVGDPTIRILIGATAPALLFLAVSSEWLLVAVGQIYAVSLSRVAGAFAGAAAAILFVRSPDDILEMSIVIMAPLAVAAALTLAMTFVRVIRLTSIRLPSWSMISVYRADAWHYLQADLSILIYASIDRIFLYIVATPAVVGLYEAAYKLIQPFNSIAVVVNDSQFVRLASTFENPERERRILRIFNDLMFVATVPAGFFFVLFATPIVLTIYGPAFAESGRYLALLGWVTTVTYLAGAVTIPFVAWKRPRDYSAAQVTGTVVNVIANVILVPLFLAVGAALANLTAKAGVAIVGFRGYRRATQYPVLRDFGAYLAFSTGALMAGLLSEEVLQLATWVSIGVFAATYGALVYFLRWHSLRPWRRIDAPRLESPG